MLFKTLALSAFAISSVQAAFPAPEAVKSLAEISAIAVQSKAFADAGTPANQNQTGANISEYLGKAYIKFDALSKALSEGDPAPAYSHNDQVLVSNAWTAYTHAEEAFLKSLNAKRELYPGFLLPFWWFSSKVQAFGTTVATNLTLVAPTKKHPIEASKLQLDKAFEVTLAKYQPPQPVAV